MIYALLVSQLQCECRCVGFDDPKFFYESGSGFGALPAVRLSSGSGTNSLLSVGGSNMRPCFQSSLACSIRSLREETKFHQICLSPNGSPPKSMSVVLSFATLECKHDVASAGLITFVSQQINGHEKNLPSCFCNLNPCQLLICPEMGNDDAG